MINRSHAMRALGAVVMSYGAADLAWRASAGMVGDLVNAVRTGGLGSPAMTVDRLTADVAAALLVVAAALLAVLVTLSAAAVLLDRRQDAVATFCRRATPAALRRLVAAWCGVALAAPLLAGTAAVAGEERPVHPCVRVCTASPDLIAGLPYPDLPTGEALHADRPDRPGRTSDPGADSRSGHRSVVRVEPGDSLWLIAARLAPVGADDAAIASLTARLYRLNRSTVGPDPDLVQPGMLLHVPKGTS